jgi:hypothetical protein
MADSPTDLIRKHGAAMGLDDASSSVIIAGMNKTVMPMCMGSPFDEDEEACDDFLLQMYVLDGSGSMDIVEELVREGFNDVIMPGLLEGAADQVGGIRFNGLVFSDNIRSLFGIDEWQKLDKKYPRLTPANYTAGGLTCLNRGVMAGAVALMSHAAEVKEITGTAPRCQLIALSDGKDRDPHKNDPKIFVPDDKVKLVLDRMDPKLVTTIFYGWQTGEAVDFHEIAANLGFREIKDLKKLPGESDADFRKRVRHDLGVFSQKLIRASVNKVVAPDPTTGSTGFWN